MDWVGTGHDTLKRRHDMIIVGTARHRPGDRAQMGRVGLRFLSNGHNTARHATIKNGHNMNYGKHGNC